jgi:hypothetical protein
LPLQGQFPEHQKYLCLGGKPKKCTLKPVQSRF